MKKIMIIKTGATFSFIRAQYGDFEEQILAALALPAEAATVIPVYESAPLPPDLDKIAGVIITGSHAMVTDRASWSVQLIAWLSRLRSTAIPILGICYGHQLLAEAFGGKVDYRPGGEHTGTVEIVLTAAGRGDALLGVMPEVFLGHVSHAQTVAILPPGAKLLAYNTLEAHHAYVLDEHIWGVQFHPEFNAGIVRSYLEADRVSLQQEGKDVDGLLAAVQEHNDGKLLLRRFWQIAAGKC